MVSILSVIPNDTFYQQPLQKQTKYDSKIAYMAVRDTPPKRRLTAPLVSDAAAMYIWCCLGAAEMFPCSGPVYVTGFTAHETRIVHTSEYRHPRESPNGGSGRWATLRTIGYRSRGGGVPVASVCMGGRGRYEREGWPGGEGGRHGAAR